MKWLGYGFLFSLVLALAVAGLLIITYPSPTEVDTQEQSLTVATHCADRVVCYTGSLASFTYSCFRDADLVAKYCGEAATPP